MESTHKFLEISKEIENWYESNGRSFPWRKKNISPFEVLVTEFLLWKTRAENVQRFFNGFIEKYDSPEKLAKASFKSLAEEIKPLGLYERRAKLLIKIGRFLLNKEIPKTEEKLEQLPGVGQYIARAILCFGYRLPIIPVDNNVQRVIKRVFGLHIQNLRKLKKEEHKLLSKLASTSKDCRKLGE